MGYLLSMILQVSDDIQIYDIPGGFEIRFSMPQDAAW